MNKITLGLGTLVVTGAVCAAATQELNDRLDPNEKGIEPSEKLKRYCLVAIPLLTAGMTAFGASKLAEGLFDPM